MLRFSAFLVVFFISFNVFAQKSEVSELLDKIHADSLIYFVKQLSGELPVRIQGNQDTIKSRYYLHPDNEKAFLFLKEKLQSYQYTVKEQQFSEYGKNLIAVKEGSLKPDFHILIGAHYDSRPAGDISPGANDNASGTSAVIEIARVLKDNQFPYTLKFIFFDEEELGLIGSKAFARTVGSENETLIGYINLDMLGWDEDENFKTEIHVRDIAGSLELADLAVRCNEEYAIGLSPEIINPGTLLTDHASFWNEGHTAIGINEEYSGEDAYPYIHTVADTVGHFNIPFFYRNSKLAAAVLAELAMGETESVGINEFVADRSVQIYPNPFSSKIFINNFSSENIKGIALLDLTGRVRYQTNQVRTSSITVPAEIPLGIYFLQIETGKRNLIKTVVKK